MKLLQNRVSESNATLPVTAVYGILLWLVAGLISERLYLPFVLVALSSALMMELNNRNALLRIRSRMVSVSYIVLWCMANFMFADISAAVTTFGTVVSLLLLFMQYHDNRAPGYTFYTFAVIGLVSLQWVQILFFVPVIWLLMLSYIQNMSWSSFVASIIGLIAPYWFAAAYYFVTDNMYAPLEHIMSIADFGALLVYENIQLNQIVTLAVVVVLAVIGMVHYMRNSFQDKIHNRMLYYCFFWLDIAAFVFMLLQPQHYNQLLAMMIVFTAPLTAHFIALTNTRFTNITAIVITVIVLIVTVFNLWTPSLIYFQGMDI